MFLDEKWDRDFNLMLVTENNCDVKMANPNKVHSFFEVIQLEEMSCIAQLFVVSYHRTWCNKKMLLKNGESVLYQLISSNIWLILYI